MYGFKKHLDNDLSPPVNIQNAIVLLLTLHHYPLSSPKFLSNESS